MARSNTALLALLAFVVLATPARADDWDDFSNNLATDLAPLLSLFGEQVTKQFLSENITRLDYFIFAMAPMGIITAIVSAIRVCGSSSLRAFIGRAQEGGGTAEAELCSSTSRDVCELFNNGGIARVFGRPKILEIVFVRPITPQQPGGQDADKFASGSIYTFDQYVHTHGFDQDWHQTNFIGSQLGAFAPNLSLNIGIKRKHAAIYFTVAVLGFLLQAGVLAFAGVITYRLKWLKNGLPIPSYAYPLAAVGTVILAIGQYACAAVIGRSTDEGIWRRTKSAREGSSQVAVTFHWLQPGPQTIGDQVFDAFSTSDKKDPLLEYVRSIKQQDYEGALMVWLAVVTTLVGFVLQFVGLRVMHSSVAVAQLGAIMIMSAVRSALRMQRLKKEDNELADCPDLVAGHELDWLALNLETPQIYRALELPLEHERHKFPHYLPLFCFGGTRPPRKSGNTDAPISSAFTKEDMNLSENRITSTLMAHRSKLAELTASQEVTDSDSRYTRQAQRFNTDTVTVRQHAEKLASAMDIVIDIMRTKKGYLGNGTLEATVFQLKSFRWSVACFVGVFGELKSEERTTAWQGEPETVSLNLGLAPESWKRFNIERIEALLGLWVWSLKSSRIRTKNGRMITVEGDIRRKRVILPGTVAKSQLELWLGRGQENIKKEVLRPKRGSGPSGLTFWRKSTASVWHPATREDAGSANGVPTYTDSSPDSGFFARYLYTLGHVSTRYWGWFALPDPDADDVGSGTLASEITVYAAATNTNIVTLCAQEIFGYFTKSVIQAVESAGEVDIHDDEGNLRLNNGLVNDLVKAFVVADLGTHEEAILCVLPCVVLKFQSSETLAVAAATREADRLRKSGEWAGAANVLLWAFDICNSRFEKDIADQVPPQHAEEDALVRATVAIGELYRKSFMPQSAKDDKLPLGENVFDTMLHRWPNLAAAQQVVARYQEIGERIKSLRPTPDWAYATGENGGIVEVLVHLTWGSPLADDALLHLLHSAARNGWTEVVLAMLESTRGAQPDLADSNRQTPIFGAVQQGHFDIVKLLLDWGAGLDRRDYRYSTPLWRAAESGHTAIAKLLLDRGASPYPRDHLDRTPLWIAAREGHIDIVKLLLADTRVDPDSKGRALRAPPTAAASQGDQDIKHDIHTPISRVPPDPVYMYNSGAITPLAAAIRNGHSAVVSRLLADNRVSADAACGGKLTPLMVAADAGNEEIARILIAAGAGVDLCCDDKAGRPITFAARSGHMGTVKLLLDSGSQECKPDVEQSKYPAVVMASEHGHDEIVALLVSRGADINVVHIHDDPARIPCTALKHALISGSLATVRLLLDSGVVVHNGILKEALMRSNEAAAHLLLEEIMAGVKVVSDDPEDLYAAVKHGKASIVRRLIEGGRARVDEPMKNDSNLTVLHLAAENSDDDMVQVLLEAGAKVDPEWFASREPLWFALMAPHTNGSNERGRRVVKLLAKHGANLR